MQDCYFLDVFRRMCEEEKISWYLNDQESGYITQVNGTVLRIIGSETAWIMLTISKGFKQYTIQEPKPHISEAPIGRLISFLKKQMGLPALSGPQTSEDKNKSVIRNHLNAILKIARDQHMKKCLSGEYFSGQFKKELLDSVIFPK